jgi:hypothetical protein
MPKYTDTCPACGEEFKNYTGGFATLCCSVGCEANLYSAEENEFCKHNHVDYLCILCEKELKNENFQRNDNI